IVQVGMQAMADRYLYVPFIALAFLPVWSYRVPAALLLAVCAVLTWRQTEGGRDGGTLFTHALAVTRANFVTPDKLRVELDRVGRPDEALAHYTEALRIRPGDRHAEENYAQASFAKGERLFAAGNLDPALAAFREGLLYRPNNALAHTEAGRILS